MALSNSWAQFGSTVVAVLTAPVATVASLSSVPDAAMPAGVLIYVLSGTYWRLDRTSASTPDGVTVVATQSGQGRWLLIQGVGATYATSVASRTALSAFADAPLQDGAISFNTEAGYRAEWRLDKTASLAADGVTVIATQSGSGKWVLNSRYSGVVPVTECGAVGDGSTDDSSAFHAAANALSGTGIVLGVPGRTYAFANPCLVPSSIHIRGDGGSTVLKSTMTPTGGAGGTAKSVFASFATPATNLTTLTSNVALGSTTIPISSTTGLSVGQTILLQRATTNLVLQQFTILHIGSGNITVDDPTEFGFQNGDNLVVPTSPPTNITIENMTISGTGDRGIELVSARFCLVSNVQVTRQYGSFTAMGMSFDTGGRDNEFRDCFVDGGAVSAACISIENNVRSRAVKCTACYAATGSSNGNFYLPSCARCDLQACSGYESGGYGAMVTVSANADTDGSARCTVSDCHFYGSALAGLVVYGSTGIQISNTTSDFNTGDGIQFLQAAAGQGCVDCAVVNSNVSDNGAYGLELLNNNHIVHFSNLTASRCTSGGIAQNGTGVLRGAVYYSDDCQPIVFNSSGSITIDNALVRKTGSSGTWEILMGTVGSTLELSNYVAQYISGSGNTAIADIEAACTVRLRNVRTLGSMAFGVYINAAAEVHIASDCNFDSASAPLTVTGSGVLPYADKASGLYTDATTSGTVTLALSVAQRSGSMKFAQSLSNNITYNVPAGLVGMWNVDLSGVTLGGHTFTVGVTGGSGVSLSAAQHIVYSDGTNAHTVV